MKKKLLATLLVAGVVLSLAGCKPSEVTSNESNETTEYVEEVTDVEEVVEETETTDEVVEEVVEEVTEPEFVPMYDPATFDAVAFFEEVKEAYNDIKYIKLDFGTNGYRYYDDTKVMFVQEYMNEDTSEIDFAYYLVGDENIAIVDNDAEGESGVYRGYTAYDGGEFQDTINLDGTYLCPTNIMSLYVPESTLVEETESTITLSTSHSNENASWEQLFTFDKETKLLKSYTHNKYDLDGSFVSDETYEWEYFTEESEGFNEFTSKFEIPEYIDMR